MTDAAARANRRLLLQTGWRAGGAALLLGVAVASLLPAPDIGVGDKLSHLMTYAVLGGYFALLVTRWQSLTGVAIGLTVYGSAIEGLQGLTGYRFAEAADILANTIGVLLGLILYFTPAHRLLRLIDRRFAAWLGR